MRIFNQLTGPEQEVAVNHCLDRLLTGILEGAVRFNDALNRDTLQAAIDAAGKEADDNQTPWFAGEYIMEARYLPILGHVTDDDGLWSVGEALRGMAHCDAEDAQYVDAGERPIFRITGTPADGFKVGVA